MRRPFVLSAMLLAVSCAEAPASSPPKGPMPQSPAPSPSASSPSASKPVDPAPLDLDPVEWGLRDAAALCDGSLKTAENLLSEIRALKGAPDAALTWESTLGKLDLTVLALKNAGDFPALLAVAHPDENVRNSAKGCEPKIEKLLTALYLDQDLATVFKRYAAKKEKLDGPKTRLLEHTLRDYRRNGLDLDDAGKKRLRELNTELTRMSQEFEANLANSTDAIEVSPADLAGLPDSYVASHKPGPNGKVKITTDYPDYFPVLQYAKNRKLALDLYVKFDNRAADKNVVLLEEIIRLRSEKAKLLGFSTWADYVLEPRMAKDAKTVAGFLEDLRKHLAKKSKAEFAEFEKMHAKLGGKAGEPLPPSDRTYLEDQVRKEKFGFDSKAVSEYLEVTKVRQGILDITSKLFGIHYRELKGAKTWHEDVQAMEVLGDGDKVIGRFYFDLYPRPGKYKHAAVFSIRDTHKANGERLMPVAAIVCNFPKPGKADEPALMSHQDATTFFHEFGHVLHHLLSESELASFAGTSVARDFVEAPSQMLEEWAWTRETLDVFAKHYKTGAPLPDALYKAMVKSRGFGRGLQTARQLFLAALDQTYHTRAPGMDTTKVLQEINDAYTPFKYVQGTHFQATFGHLMGYDAGYYGYQWALSIAQDLLTRFKKEGMLNGKTAAEYKKAVLAPGGSDDENHLVATFLGRKPNSDAYKKFLTAE